MSAVHVFDQLAELRRKVEALRAAAVASSVDQTTEDGQDLYLQLTDGLPDALADALDMLTPEPWHGALDTRGAAESGAALRL